MKSTKSVLSLGNAGYFSYWQGRRIGCKNGVTEMKRKRTLRKHEIQFKDNLAKLTASSFVNPSRKFVYFPPHTPNPQRFETNKLDLADLLSIIDKRSARSTRGLTLIMRQCQTPLQTSPQLVPNLSKSFWRWGAINASLSALK